MEQLIDPKPKRLSVEEIRENPELIAQLLLQEQDVSVIFEKRGDEVNYAYLKVYDTETIRVLQEAKTEYNHLKDKGYNREQAVKDFEEAQEEINKYSSS